jgi:hypothetical protein
MASPANHLPHLLLLLHAIEKLRDAPTGFEARPSTPHGVFLARDEREHFWELIGCRVKGHPALLFGAIRFRRQPGGTAAAFPRQSLVSYLSAPVREVALDRTPRPPHLIELLVPDAAETVQHFLLRARRDGACRTLFLDRRDIELAFDFRLANPSRIRPAAEDPQPDGLHMFRTSSGHVLSATPHHLSAKLHRSDDFVALTGVTQHAAAVDRPLPTLVLHRAFLTMAAPADDDPAWWLEHSLPFQAALANPKHILDPLLESYRAHRQRLLRREAPPDLGAPAALERAAAAGSQLARISGTG